MYKLAKRWMDLLQSRLSFVIIQLFIICAALFLIIILGLSAYRIVMPSLLGFIFGLNIIYIPYYRAKKASDENLRQQSAYMRNLRGIIEEITASGMGTQIGESICNAFGYSNLCLMVISQEERNRLQNYSLEMDPDQKLFEKMTRDFQVYYYGAETDKLKKFQSRIIMVLFARPTPKIPLPDSFNNRRSRLTDYYREFGFSDAISIAPREISGGRFVYVALINRLSDINWEEVERIKQQIETKTHPLFEIAWFLIENVIDAEKLYEIENQLYKISAAKTLEDAASIALNGLQQISSFSVAIVYQKGEPNRVIRLLKILESSIAKSELLSYLSHPDFISYLNSINDLANISPETRIHISQEIKWKIHDSATNFSNINCMLIPIHGNNNYREILLIRTSGPEFTYNEYQNFLRLLRLAVTLYEQKSDLSRKVLHDITKIVRNLIETIETSDDAEWKKSIQRAKEEWEKYKICYMNPNETEKTLLNLGDVMDDALEKLGLCDETNIYESSWCKGDIMITANYRVPGNKKENLEFEGYMASLFSAFLNILQNAKEAMAESDVKKIDINIAEEDKCLKISISDTGKGIEKEHINEIWRHSFSSKKDLDNKGIGLSAVVDCVDKHNGHRDVMSDGLGKGANFILKFPK